MLKNVKENMYNLNREYACITISIFQIIEHVHMGDMLSKMSEEPNGPY